MYCTGSCASKFYKCFCAFLKWHIVFYIIIYWMILKESKYKISATKQKQNNMTENKHRWNICFANYAICYVVLGDIEILKWWYDMRKISQYSLYVLFKTWCVHYHLIASLLLCLNNQQHHFGLDSLHLLGFYWCRNRCLEIYSL